jgi:hypothetical protein
MRTSEPDEPSTLFLKPCGGFVFEVLKPSDHTSTAGGCCDVTDGLPLWLPTIVFALWPAVAATTAAPLLVVDAWS